MPRYRAGPVCCRTSPAHQEPTEDTGASRVRHARSLPPGMNHERDQPLADAEAAYLRAARYAEECRHRCRRARALAAPTSGRRRAITVVTTTALDRVSVVWCVATRASRGLGVVWRVSLWVGLVLRLVCEVLVSVSCVSRLPPRPGVFEPVQECERAKLEVPEVKSSLYINNRQPYGSLSKHVLRRPAVVEGSGRR